MIFSDVITPARRALHDSLKQVWSNAMLLGFCTDGVRDLASRRPELRLKSDGTMGDIFEADDGALTGDRFRFTDNGLELWDETLSQYLPVALDNGNLIAMEPAEGGDVLLGTDIIALDVDLGIDATWRAALVHYVVWRALDDAGSTPEEAAKAATQGELYEREVMK